LVTSDLIILWSHMMTIFIITYFIYDFITVADPVRTFTEYRSTFSSFIPLLRNALTASFIIKIYFFHEQTGFLWPDIEMRCVFRVYPFCSALTPQRDAG